MQQLSIDSATVHSTHLAAVIDKLGIPGESKVLPKTTTTQTKGVSRLVFKHRDTRIVKLFEKHRALHSTGFKVVIL
jgi:hypothetical protein